MNNKNISTTNSDIFPSHCLLFKDFYGVNHYIADDYGQNCTIGKALATQFHNVVTDGNDTHQQHIKLLFTNLPKSSEHDGLKVGFFYQLSVFLEPLIENRLPITLKNNVLVDWLSKFTWATNDLNSDGAGRNLLGDMFFSLPKADLDSFYDGITWLVKTRLISCK
jgi:hypothetical protein